MKHWVRQPKHKAGVVEAIKMLLGRYSEGGAMRKLKEALQSKKNPRILDIGTGQGGFIKNICELTDEFNEIIGIDTNERAIEAAKKNFDDPRISFLQMDALNMTFEEGSFDVVCLSNSLHHLGNVEETISEMERMLNPDGILLFNEMFSDVDEPEQLTHVYLHHFWAEIDRLNGVSHNETMTRQGIIDTLNAKSSLSVQDAWNMVSEEGSEKELSEEDYDMLKGTLDQAMARVADPEQLVYFQKKAEPLKDRLDVIGFKLATQLLVIMK